MRHPRMALAAGAAIAVLVFIAAILIAMTGGSDKPLVGGPFRLRSQTGDIIDSAALKGRPYAIFFGFTRCPEVCPTTMMDMQRVLDRVGPKAMNFKVYFVSVDPERDTPETLRSYLGSFEPHMVGLTGTPEEIAAVAKAFRVYYRRVPTSDGDYTLDHTAIVYLMGADGRFVDLIGYQESEERAVAKMKKLLGG